MKQSAIKVNRYTPFADHHPAGFRVTGHNSNGDAVGYRVKEASTTVGMRVDPNGSYVQVQDLEKAHTRIRDLERKLAKASKMIATMKAHNK